LSHLITNEYTTTLFLFLLIVIQKYSCLDCETMYQNEEMLQKSF